MAADFIDNDEHKFQSYYRHIMINVLAHILLKIHLFFKK